MSRYEYAIRMHTRLTENDPELATVMYGIDGTWWDMATGHPDHIEDIIGALEWREHDRSAEREAEAARLLEEIEEVQRFHGLDRPQFTVWTEQVGNPAQQDGMCVDDPEEARRG